MEQKKTFRTTLHTRVSTVELNAEMQLRALQAYADYEGWWIVETTTTSSVAPRPAAQD